MFALGCVSNPQYHDDKILEVDLVEPKCFSGYDELFKYISQNELIPRGIAWLDKYSTLKIAADSSIKIDYPEDKMPPLYVVTPNYYLFSSDNKEIYNAIRGTQGNGTYYLVAASPKHLVGANLVVNFKLIGIATGNNYRWEHINGVPMFITTWHESASRSSESIYKWDGKIFKEIKVELPNYK